MAKSKFAAGALVGAAAGLIAGLLTAPKSGKQTRADIKLKAAELKHEADKRTAHPKSTGSQQATRAANTKTGGA